MSLRKAGDDMLLKCVNTGSQNGNCYILENDTEALILDAGVRYKDVLKALDYNISKVTGLLLTHEHGDHTKAFKDFIRSGIPVYGCDELQEHLEIVTGEKIIGKQEKISFQSGDFRIVPFYVPHDGCPCFAYIIYHPECGNILYATDMSRIAQIDENYRLKMVNGRPMDWSFKNLRLAHMIIEANYDFSDFADMDEFKRSHVGFGHHSLQCCKRFVEENKTPDLRNVILCHLSSENADPDRMKSEIQEVAGKWVNVDVAHAALEVELSKYAF